MFIVAAARESKSQESKGFRVWDRKSGRNVVLLVADNADDAMLIQVAFRRIGRGYELRHVPDGKAAMAYLLGQEQFANREEFPAACLILVDLVLPSANGLQFLEWVRKEPKIDLVPIVVLSDSQHSRFVDRAYKLRADSFLRKPFEFAEFEKELRQALEYWAPTRLKIENDNETLTGGVPGNLTYDI